MKMRPRTLACVAAALLAVATASPAAELRLPDTQVRSLRARASGVDYKIYVSLPHEYGTAKASYPVLYLLDADYSFPVGRAMVQHLSDRSRLPKLIVVGIAYGGPDRYRMNRTRDYTPTFTLSGGYGPDYQKVSGGAPKFLAFIRDELVPWMDRSYRTKPGERALVGHSYGGLFASWVLVTAPDTFSRYVLVSPSLWYDEHLMMGLEEKTRSAAGASPGARIKVFCGVGSREHDGDQTKSMVVDLAAFVGALRARGANAPDIRSEVFEDETHDSVFPTALSRGIRFVFDGD